MVIAEESQCKKKQQLLLVLLLLLRTTHTLYNDDVDIFLQTSYINERDHTKVIAYSKKYLNN